ncbi:MAG: hypothetical protein V1701_03230 [Planctomycetota bacterium]
MPILPQWTPDFFLPDHSITRLLVVKIPYYTIHQNRKQVFVLTKKPEALEHLNSINQRTWKQYQAYLNKITPVEKASFYNRLKKRHGVNSIRALAKITGEDWSRIAKILKVLELPEPILQFLRENKTPGLMRYFTEKRLRQLVLFKDHRLLYRKFKLMVEDARKQTGLWASDTIDYTALKTEEESTRRGYFCAVN